MDLDQMAMNSNNNPTTTARPNTTKTKPQEWLNCPRCNSANTKFCYYNNYSLAQPRYICKTCRRYWTAGGSLRNVPVGGGSRKNKKFKISSSSSSKASSTSSKILSDLNPPFVFPIHQNPITQEHRDHNFPLYSTQGDGQGQLGNFSRHLRNPICSSSLQLLGSGGLNSNFTAAPVLNSNTMYDSSGFSLNQDYKLTHGFSKDGSANKSGISEVQENVINGSRVLFPFMEMKQTIPSTPSEVENHQLNIKRQSNASNDLWDGMLSGGPSW